MPDDPASRREPVDATPRIRRAANLQLRFFKGMYVMHMERVQELRREFWEATLRGDRKRAQWTLQDAHAMAKEAQELLRKQHVVERRLLYLPPPKEGEEDPRTVRVRPKPRLRILESSTGEKVDTARDTPPDSA